VNVARPPSTPLLNVPDQVWNNGEGFPAAMGQPPFALVPNQGGFLSADYVEGLRAVDIHSFWPQGASAPTNWHTYQFVNHQQVTVTVSRFVGYLRPSQLGGYATQNGAPILDAAFEIFAPTSYDPAKPTVVVIGCWATHPTPLDPAASGPQNQRADRFKYPGFRRADGLVLAGTAGIARPGPDIVNLVANPPSGHQVISAYIVPRTFPRPMVFEMQRYRQLAKAIDLMLGQPGGSALLPPTFPTLADPLPKLLAGGSFGGLTAQAGVLQFPNEFHGAAANAFSGSVRRTMGEQFTWDLIGRRCGTGLYETSLNLQDTLEWGAYYRLEGWDYFNSSTMLRLRRGEVYRPMMFLVADEDTVTCGVDWLPSLSGVRGYAARGLALGVAPQGFVSPSIYWSVVDRRCHGEGGELVTPVGGVPSDWIADADREFVTVVATEAAQNAGQVAVMPPFVADDGSEDPYDELLARGVRPPGPSSPLLQLDPNFGAGGRTVGHGLTLGWDESLKSIRVANTTHLYAGDADGVVHRFVFDVATSGFVEQARSRSLGFGAWALEYGALDGLGDVLVVGTLRHLHLLDPLTLVPVGNPSVLELDFEWERPRRIALADVHATHAGNEILVSTFQGHLLVFDPGFDLLTDLGEPGIQDFVVHEGAAYTEPGTTSDVPITILSHRGHLANVTLDVPGGPIPCPARLHCWTKVQRGAPGDLELVGGQVIASFNLQTATGTALVRAFDAMTLQPATVPLYGAGLTTGASPFNDLCVVHDTGGSVAGFVVGFESSIAWVPVSGTPATLGAAGLIQFAPLANHCAVATADLLPAPNYREEVVVGTVPGHLVVFTVDELIAAAVNGTSLTWDRPGENGLPFDAAPPRTNHTLAATWGFVSRWYTPDGDILLPQLLAATQAGELFEVDPLTGRSVFAIDYKLPIELPLQSPPHPPNPVYLSNVLRSVSQVRDLGVIGENAMGVPTFQLPGFITPDRYRWPTVVAPPGQRQLWWYRSLPNQDRWGLPMQPQFYKDWHSSDPWPPPHLPVCTGVAAFIDGGAVRAYPPGTPGGLQREMHWWGGTAQTYRNLIQGASVTSSDVVNSWYSAKNVTGSMASPPPYGRNPSEGKDLRNHQRYATTYNLQSLRLGRDGLGTVIVAGTPGGSVTLMRPADPQDPSAPNSDFGRILWESHDTEPDLDDGHGCMALAVRQVPGASPPALDIFYGACLTCPEPSALLPTDVGMNMVGSVRWLRWQNGAMTLKGPPVLLDAPGGGHGGFAVSGCAVGDVVDQVPGDELVVTTLAGDLYVFQLGPDSIQASPLERIHVGGGIGGFNAIVIEDMDLDFRKELYVAGAHGIRKWRQL
jgi:hypothetical protein